MNTITKTLWMLTTISVVCLLAMTSAFPSYAESLYGDIDFSAVDAYVEAQMKTLKIPGLALAIVQGDQIAYMRGYGKADPDGNPVTPQTSFIIGSTTKSFTALAIMQLVEAGQIELDAPVQTYLPWFRVADPQASAQITVRHLLNQTSGFSNASGHDDLAASDLSDDAIENKVRSLANVELVHSPGAVYEYSNPNFQILGLIVQTVSGQTYENYVQEHIFDPLEMSHSFTSQDEAMQNGMATGYSRWFGIPFPKNVPFNRGALSGGYLICSVEDLAHYLIAQLNDGRYGTVPVLSSEGIAAMHAPAVPTETLGGYYGMAWSVGSLDGISAVYHSGDTANYMTYLLMIPEEKLGVAVTYNMFSLFAAGGQQQIAEGVTAIMMGKQPQVYQPFDRLPLMVGSVVAPAVLSILWIAWMVYRFVRRQRKGLPSRRGFLWAAWVIMLPLLVDLGLLWVLLMGIPKLWEGNTLGSMALYFPDMFTLMTVSAVALGGWGVARTVLTLLSVRNQPNALP
jgi:CubicO group peptidase (beta-lactamase class C family)